jgi:alpha-glucosidase (family GH31 glycosyl hydrolase)
MPYLVEGTRLHDRLAAHGMGDREPCRRAAPARRVTWGWIRFRYRLLPYVLAEAGQAAARGCRSPGRRRAFLPAGTWTDWWTRERAPFEEAGRTELRVPVDGRGLAIRYEARTRRHLVEIGGHPGRVVLDAPAGVELRR